MHKNFSWHNWDLFGHLEPYNWIKFEWHDRRNFMRILIFEPRPVESRPLLGMDKT